MKKETTKKNTTSSNSTKKREVKDVEVEETKNTIEEDMESSITENKGQITVKQKCIACLLVGIIIGALAMSLCWPKRIAKLKNGEEPVATVGEYTVSADEVYESLKNETALTRVLDLIDYYILLDMYGETDDADVYAKEQAEMVYTSYEQYYGYSKEEFLELNGYKSEEEFLTYLNHDYYYSKYYDEYLLKQVTDEDVEEYYNNSVGASKVVHLYTTYDDTVDLNDIKKELDKGTSIEKINSKYEGAVYTELGEISFKDYANYSETFLTNLYPLKEGQTSSVFQDGYTGSSLIYVESVGDKEALEDIREDLKSVLAQIKGTEDDTLYYKAFIDLREENNLKFNDTEYKELYDSYVASLE